MKVCAKCGGDEFNSRNKCKSCERTRAKKYYANNKEKHAAAVKKWKSENPDKIKAINDRWKKNNPGRVNELQKIWSAKHPERRRAIYTKWRNANRDSLIARCVQWRIDNPNCAANYYAENSEKIKASSLKWKRENPEISRIHCHNYRAKKRTNGGKLSKDLSAKLFKLQHGMCACGCGQPLGEKYELDHRMPIALGGENTDDNMQLLTRTCNRQKHAKHPVEFMKSRGFLL